MGCCEDGCWSLQGCVSPCADACCHVQAISSLQVQKGFRCLVVAAPDLTLDVPDAAAKIATFIARAMIDDVLPPSFVEDLSTGAAEE